MNRRRLAAWVAAAAAGVGGLVAVSGGLAPDWTRHETCKGYEACAARCEAGVASGCHLAGLALRDGEYVPRDTAGARALFDKGCELGSDAACTNVAVELRRADRKDEAREIEKRGFEVAGAGCDAGNLDDCYSQVFDLRFGWDTDTKAGQDEVRSAALASRIAPVYEKLCRQGDADACMRAGRLAKGFVGDKPSPADIERSLPHYERACELDATLCWTVGSLNEDLGRSGRSYFEKAWDPLESTCRHASLSIL